LTHPANKKRTHNDAARDANQRLSGDVAVRGATPTRRSPYGDKLRKRREGRE